MTKYYSITEAAKALKISRQRVQQLIDAGKLEAIKVGNTWVVVSLKRKEN